MKACSAIEEARLNALVAQAQALWDEGYKRIDNDYPGWVRWHTVHNADLHPPRAVPIEVWFYIRGAFFGIGDFNSPRDAT